VINHTKATIQLYKSEALVSFEDEEGHRLVSSIEPGNKVEVVVVFGKSFFVNKMAVYLLYDEPVGGKLEQYHGADCSDDEDERFVKRFSTQDEFTDDFNQNRKKKSRVE
jgi:hypothetical protein